MKVSHKRKQKPNMIMLRKFANTK